MADNFGTDENFDRYEIPPLVVTSAEAFRIRNRLWISGDDSAWTAHMIQLASQMTQAGVLHTFAQNGPRDHAWWSGWLEGAVASLAANATAVAPVDMNAQRIIAYGLRRPTRLAFRPGTHDLWVADAGSSGWEEINRIPNGADGIVENLGWPCWEGTETTGYANAGLAICNQLLPPPASLPSETYQASADFSSTQGFRNWHYLYGSGVPMTFDGEAWRGNETFLLLWENGGHPGNGSDAVRRWVAPQGGSAHITATAFDGNTTCGGGAAVFVRKNSTILGQQTIVNGNTSGVAFDVTTTVAAGDAIDFGINVGPDGNWNCDSTLFDPTIVFTPSPFPPLPHSDVATLTMPVYAYRHDQQVVADDLCGAGSGSISGLAFYGTGSYPASYEGTLFFSDASRNCIWAISKGANGLPNVSSRAMFMAGASSPVDLKTGPGGDIFFVDRDGGTIRRIVHSGGTDTAPPVRSNGAPTGTLTAGTTQTTLSLATDENATCRYATTAGVAYTSMSNAFASTGGTAHATAVSGLTNGGSYSYFVRCQDSAGNANSTDFTISFSVAQSADTTPPVRSNGAPAGTLAAGTTQTTVSLSTNEAATCRYATTPGVAYASMPSTFTTTGSTAHATIVSGLTNGGSYSYFVRCQDPAGNPNSTDFTISFSVAQSTTPPASTTYRASTDFSTTQGFRNWFYLYGSGVPMTANPGGWWLGNETFLLLWNNGGHPGNAADAVRRWVAPQAGSATITGNASDQNTSCGAGVVVSIRRNATVLWQQTIANGNSTGFAYNLTPPLAAGDNLDFVINRGAGNNDCDSTNFDPTIVFTPS
jgi:hypothetical protein